MDRVASVIDMSKDEIPYIEHPIIIHGHTPTGWFRSISDGFIAPFDGIKMVSRENIDVDCCAFCSLIMGGNLAAYRCEDGAEFYAYDMDDYKKAVDMMFSRYSEEELGFNRQVFEFYALFHSRHMLAFSNQIKSLLMSDKDRSNHDYVMGLLGNKYKFSERVFVFESKNMFAGTYIRVWDMMPKIWLEIRDEI